MYLFLNLKEFDWLTYYVHDNFMGTFKLKFPLMTSILIYKITIPSLTSSLSTISKHNAGKHIFGHHRLLSRHIPHSDVH